MWFTVLCLVVSATAAPPFVGPYSVEHHQYNVSTLYHDWPHAAVIAPKPQSAGEKFPLVIYMHGFLGGGFYEDWAPGYRVLFTHIASHGFVVVAPKSCWVGCPDYTAEAGKSIDWARNMTQDKLLSRIDWSLGAGISGHSMGGPAVVGASATEYAKKFNIQAAVAHHPSGTDGSKIGIPLAVYSGANDECCGTRASHEIWDPAPSPKFIAIKEKAAHIEPVLFSDNGLGLYTAAWFKVYIQGDKDKYHKLIFGSDADALCQHYKMSECVVKLDDNVVV